MVKGKSSASSCNRTKSQTFPSIFTGTSAPLIGGWCIRAFSFTIIKEVYLACSSGNSRMWCQRELCSEGLMADGMTKVSTRKAHSHGSQRIGRDHNNLPLRPHLLKVPSTLSTSSHTWNHKRKGISKWTLLSKPLVAINFHDPIIVYLYLWKEQPTVWGNQGIILIATKLCAHWNVNCGKWIMRSLWEPDVSTVVLNDLQAEFGMAQATEENKRQNAAQLLFLQRKK
jgi:hypothetical protein